MLTGAELPKEKKGRSWDKYVQFILLKLVDQIDSPILVKKKKKKKIQAHKAYLRPSQLSWKRDQLLSVTFGEGNEIKDLMLLLMLLRHVSRVQLCATP